MAPDAALNTQIFVEALTEQAGDDPSTIWDRVSAAIDAGAQPLLPLRRAAIELCPSLSI